MPMASRLLAWVSVRCPEVIKCAILVSVLTSLATMFALGLHLSKASPLHLAILQGAFLSLFVYIILVVAALAHLDRFNGAPFSEGDEVLILAGENKGEVGTVIHCESCGPNPNPIKMAVGQSEFQVNSYIIYSLA